MVNRIVMDVVDQMFQVAFRIYFYSFEAFLEETASAFVNFIERESIAGEKSFKLILQKSVLIYSFRKKCFVFNL